jgi:cytochrome c oxidase subunit I+III
MFALLVAGYFYLRLGYDVWPPPGVSFIGWVLPTVELAVLLLSCVPAYWATEAAIENDIHGVRKGLLLNLALAAAGLVIRIVVWHSFNFAWHSSAYGSIVWAILGLHTFEYIGAMLETAVMLGIFFSGRFGDKQRGGVDVDSLTWYFIVGSWVPLYLVVYWSQYLVRAGR